MVHTMVSYSTLPELRRRLAHFAADIFIYYYAMVPVGHSIKNCSCLWALIGTTSN